MYIKRKGWTDSEEPDSLADRYPHMFQITVYADDECRKQMELEGQIEAMIDGLLDWKEMQEPMDLTDWRSEIQ